MTGRTSKLGCIHKNIFAIVYNLKMKHHEEEILPLYSIIFIFFLGWGEVDS